jgi:hypothetical protein
MMEVGGKRKGESWPDYYFIYKLNKNELGKYLNIWFESTKMGKGDKIYADEMITVKKTDEETSSHLYNRRYNPVTIRIMCPTGAKFTQDENGNDLYRMKAQIHSIDDSSYGIWWDGLPKETLERIRQSLMDWINGKSGRLGQELNGEEFLDICISMGADEESKDYN